ncbi:hypothetical protein LSAT2_016639 [Lamellibrachia satsuma]|nr:hypothetical protein LSAT2_016639 [Lamellibrachia satsuma]
MRGAHIEDGSAAVFWGLTANVRIICYCQQALAALAVTWIWGRRCPLAERVYTRDQRATMEKSNVDWKAGYFDCEHKMREHTPYRDSAFFTEVKLDYLRHLS